VSAALVASPRDATASSGLANLRPVFPDFPARVVDGKASVNAAIRHAVWRRKPAPGVAARESSFEVFMVPRIVFKAKTGFIYALLRRLLLALHHR